MNCATQTYLNTYSDILEEMIYGMTSATLSESISHNFIVQMIPHHRAAIRMSESVLSYTQNAAIQAIASGIIRAQTQSIADMQAILCSCSQEVSPRSDLVRYQSELEQIMIAMFRQMKSARATDCIDCDYMWEMIPHHEGAVRMSELTLQYPICEGLTPILDAIITSQQKGIVQMETLLLGLGC